MTIFLLYLLKVSVCTTVFYLAYNVALSKETFFKMNRIVLLLAVLASVVLPIWTLTISKEIIISQDLRQEFFVGGFSGDQLSASIDNAKDWIDFMPVIALIVFLTGATIISIKNLYGVFQISRIIKYSIKEAQSDVNIHISKNDIIPFSWFRNIIISEEDYNSNREIIIEHERAHIHLKHNYDLLFINTVAIFQWFNPIFWLLRKELITIHEYQADNHVLKNGIDARKYQYLLISKGTLQSFSIPVVNHLCSGNFQKRIKMMLKKRSNPNKAIKVLLLIPLLAIAIAAFAKTEYVVVPDGWELQEIKEFPKSLTTKIPKFVAPQMIYPEDAKKSATKGEFYVRIKSEKGVIKLAEVIDIKDDFNTPRCEPLIIVAYGRSTEVTTEKSSETESAKGLASIKSELLRVTALLSQFDDPEWKNANHDFILQVIFELR